MDGRLLHAREHDTVAVAGTVVLHAISGRAQGPLDSVVTAADGRYRFRFRHDSLTIYLLSSRFEGIEYFSAPLILGPRGAAVTADHVVHDTSSSAPIEVRGHYWVVGQPTPAKRRPVLDLVLLHNPGPRTRVAPGSAGASWTMPLPAGADSVGVGQGEFSPEAIEHRGDSLAVLAPLLPGDRQLVVQYTVPLERTVALPVAAPADSVFVLLEEADATVRTPGFVLADTQRIENRTYRRWAGPMRATGTVEVRFAGGAGIGVLGPLVAFLALALGVVAAFALRRRHPAAVTPADRVGGLVEEIAGLDAAFAGREGELDAETWQRYQADRARLRRELDTALAARGAPR